MRNEGHSSHARGVAALLDADVPLQVQHRRNRKGRSRCGAVGQLVDFDGAVTCPRCKRRAGR